MSDALLPTTAAEPHRSRLESWLRRCLGCRGLEPGCLHAGPGKRPASGVVAGATAYLVTVGKRPLVSFHQRRSVEQAYLNALACLPEECGS